MGCRVGGSGDVTFRGPHPEFVGWGPLSCFGSVSVPRLVWRGIINPWWGLDTICYTDTATKPLSCRCKDSRTPTHHPHDLDKTDTLTTCAIPVPGFCHRAQQNPRSSHRAAGVTFCVQLYGVRDAEPRPAPLTDRLTKVPQSHPNTPNTTCN